MIEEPAVVRAIGDGMAWVEGGGVSGCARCAAGQGCGGGLLARLMRGQPQPVAAILGDAALQLRPGERVIVGIEERRLLGVAVRVYLLPLLPMFAAAALAEQHSGSEAVVALAALLGLMAGFLGLHLHGRHGELAGRYQPIVLRRDTPSSGPCARS